MFTASSMSNQRSFFNSTTTSLPTSVLKNEKNIYTVKWKSMKYHYVPTTSRLKWHFELYLHTYWLVKKAAIKTMQIYNRLRKIRRIFFVNLTQEIRNGALVKLNNLIYNPTLGAHFNWVFCLHVRIILNLNLSTLFILYFIYYCKTCMVNYI